MVRFDVSSWKGKHLCNGLRYSIVYILNVMISHAKPKDHTGMTQLAKETTVRRYAMQGARLVAFVLRLVNQPEKYHSSLSRSLPDTCSQMANDIINTDSGDMDTFKEKIEILLWYIFTESICNPQAGAFEFVAYKAFVLGCLTFQGRFPPLSAITSNASMFEYWCRLLVLRKICIEKKRLVLVPSLYVTDRMLTAKWFSI